MICRMELLGGLRRCLENLLVFVLPSLFTIYRLVQEIRPPKEVLLRLSL